MLIHVTLIRRGSKVKQTDSVQVHVNIPHCEVILNYVTQISQAVCGIQTAFINN